MMKSETISKRETEVLNLIAFEFTSAEIAKRLFLSTHTVETHRKNLLIKLDARNVAGLVRRGFEKGIIVNKLSNISLS